VSEPHSKQFTIRPCLTIAAFLVGLSGLIRLTEGLYLKFVQAMPLHWLTLAILLIGLSIGVYYGKRWAWAFSVLLCALLAYSLASDLITMSWKTVVPSGSVVAQLLLAGFTLLVYTLAILFLFLAQYKKNRMQPESVD